MKKLLLIPTLMLAGNAAFTQDTRFQTPASALTNEAAESVVQQGSNKTTGLSDTLYFASNAQVNGPFTNYVDDFATPNDSGRYYGMNAENFKGFAQLYRIRNVDVTGNYDTTLRVLGLVSRWGGSKSSTSSRLINFNIWRRDSTTANKKIAVPGRTKYFISAVPQATSVATRAIPVTGLITTNATGFAGNTITYFTSPINNVNYDMYAGYTVQYTWGSTAGDTVGLFSTGNTGSSLGTAVLETGTLDTLVSANTLIQNSAGAWKSHAEPGLLFNGGSLILFPIIQLNCPNCFDPASVKGIENNDLTFYGTFPNPATSNTNVRFSLKKGADVTISFMDATGRTVSLAKGAYGTGEHTVPLSTSNLAAGNYVCLVETSKGDGMAMQFVVAK